MDQVSDRRDWQCVVTAYFFHVRQRWDGKKYFYRLSLRLSIF